MSEKITSVETGIVDKQTIIAYVKQLLSGFSRGTVVLQFEQVDTWYPEVYPERTNSECSIRKNVEINHDIINRVVNFCDKYGIKEYHIVSSQQQFSDDEMAFIKIVSYHCYGIAQARFVEFVFGIYENCCYVTMSEKVDGL